MSWDNEETNVRFTEYVHGGVEASDDFSDWAEMCKSKGLDWESDEMKEATKQFSYAFYEIGLDCEVDLDTGEVRCWGISGKPLVDPVKV